MNARARGRPELDLAFRIRNWGWYWLVKIESGLSDDDLDRKFVGSERPRFFYHLRSMGTSPTTKRKKKPTVFSRIHANGNYFQAKQWFESKLWTFLTNPHLKKEDFTAFLQEEIERRGWFRVLPDEAPAGEWALGDDEPALSKGWSLSYQAMVRHITSIEGIDRLALLSALYREAYYDFELDSARRLSQALDIAVREFICEFPANPEHTFFLRCLQKLIQDRIQRNIWLSESDIPSAKKYTTSNRRRQVRYFMSWYMIEGKSIKNSGFSQYPIVTNSERTQWLRTHKRSIHRQFKSACASTENLELLMLDKLAPFDESRFNQRFDRRLNVIDAKSRQGDSREQRILKRLNNLGGPPPPPEHPLLPEPEDGFRSLAEWNKCDGQLENT